MLFKIEHAISFLPFLEKTNWNVFIEKIENGSYEPA
jgi:hypothetical protein